MGAGVGEPGLRSAGDSPSSDPGSEGNRYAAVPDRGTGMTQRGIALLEVLWTLTAVAMLAGAIMTVARVGSSTTRNRVLLTRASWAREACTGILQRGFAGDA